MKIQNKIILMIFLSASFDGFLQFKTEKQIHEGISVSVDVCDLCVCHYYPKISIQCGVRSKSYEIDLKNNEQSKEVTYFIF